MSRGIKSNAAQLYTPLVVVDLFGELVGVLTRTLAKIVQLLLHTHFHTIWRMIMRMWLPVVVLEVHLVISDFPDSRRGS